MASYPYNFPRDIDMVLSRIRSSLDPLTVTLSQKDLSPDDLKYCYLSFEEVRIGFRMDPSSRLRGRQPTEYIIEELARSLRRLIEDARFSFVTDHIRYRGSTTIRREAPFSLPPSLLSRDLSVREAVGVLSDSLIEVPVRQPTFDLPAKATSNEVANVLKRILPASQEVGPVQFEFDDIGRIKIRMQRSGQLQRDDCAVAEAKDEILASGRRIIEQLNRSNCDRRIIEGIEVLQERLESNKDVVRLGLANISCDFIHKSCQEELSPAVSAMLEAHTLSINMYVSQFPEWRRFTDQAAATNLSSEHREPLSSALSVIIRNLNARPDIADPEVPTMLEAMRSSISDSNQVSNRAIFGVWRTLENFLQSVFDFGADFFRSTVRKTSTGLSTAISSAIVVAIMSTALAGAMSIAPIAETVHHSKWIQQAIEVVKKQIESSG